MKLKSVLALLLVFILVLGSCTPAETEGEPQTEAAPPAAVEEPDDEEVTETEPDSQTTEGETPVGGNEGRELAENQELTGLYSGEITTLNYLATSFTNEFSVLANFVDTLIDYDKYGAPTAAIAESWEHNDDMSVWTFKLREDAMWYDADGNEVRPTTAHDFVTSAEYILNQANASSTSNILADLLVNGQQYYDGEVTDFAEVGVKAIDDYTIEYSLQRPTPYFLSMLTYVSFMPVNGEFLEEQGANFGTSRETILYNGAYLFETFSPQSERVYVKNPNYYDADNVFIERISLRFNQEASTLAPEMYARGEITSASIPTNVLDSWMNDPARKEMIRPSLNGTYTYWYAFNFDPKFDEQYEPENWAKAVRNKNFRKSFYYALDRAAANLTENPYDPEFSLTRTITPETFVDFEGKDYTDFDPLKPFKEEEAFDPEKAVEFKEAAMAELEGEVTFPVIVYTRYNPSLTNWANRVQVIKQQMETVLGTDYIRFEIEPGPTTGFLSGVRHTGDYGFLEVNWGPDFLDPVTFTEPFKNDNNYAFNYMNEEFSDANGPIYDQMVEKANAEAMDLEERYRLFAEAEAYLIEEAIVIPYALSNGGYNGSHLDPFEFAYSPFGVSEYRYKGVKVYAEPFSTEDFQANYEKWQQEREEVLSNQGE